MKHITCVPPPPSRRAAQLGRQQHEWADSCAGAALLLRHSRTLSAVALYLDQQVLALRGDPRGLLGEVADRAQHQRYKNRKNE